MALAPDGTGYTAIARDDGTYEVEVVHPSELPEVVTGFATEREAERWILSQISAQPKDLPDITTIRP